jgi:sulfotransferase family protein
MNRRVRLAPPLRGIERIVAIVGCQRSGTTLTGQIIGAHPEAMLIDEWDGLYRWFHAQMAGAREAGALAQEMLDRAIGKYRDPYRRGRIVNGGVALDARVRLLVLKAPNLTYDDDKLARLDVPVTVIYPVRDPRAVVTSMARLAQIDFLGNQRRLIGERPATAARYAVDVRKMADETIPVWVRRATMWRIKTGRASDFERRGIPVSAFRYEDLVRDPQVVVAHVLAACELSECSAVLDAHSAYEGYGPGGTDRTRALDQACVSRWREFLEEAQQRDVIEAAAPLAARFGYA